MTGFLSFSTDMKDFTLVFLVRIFLWLNNSQNVPLAEFMYLVYHVHTCHVTVTIVTQVFVVVLVLHILSVNSRC